MEQVSKIPKCGFLGRYDVISLFQGLHLQEEKQQGQRQHWSLHVSQKTAIHTFSGSYRGGGNFSGMPLNSRLSTKDIWWYKH